MLLPYTTLNVFTHTRYRGNPLAIIRVPASYKSRLTQTRKQEIASDFNLSEIVFLHETSPDASEVAIDIFTSSAEIPFAGHPTIGTANWLFQNGWGVERLITKAGVVGISYSWSANEGNGKGRGMAELRLPHEFHVHGKRWENESVDGLRCERGTGEERGELVSIVKGMSFFMVQCGDLEMLGKEGMKNLVDTFGSTHLLDEGWREGLIGTYYFTILEETQGLVKVRSRMWGSREDPATGSATSGFACWWALKNRKGETEVRFAVTQGVEMGRKSEIGVVVRKTGDGGGIEEVRLSGEAVKVMEGLIEVE